MSYIKSVHIFSFRFFDEENTMFEMILSCFFMSYEWSDVENIIDCNSKHEKATRIVISDIQEGKKILWKIDS